LVVGPLVLPPAVHAAVRLANDWPSGFSVDGRLLPEDQHEPSHLRLVAEKLSRSMDAAPKMGSQYGLGFKLFIDDVKYYIAPAMFMPKSLPDDVCTPKDFKNFPTYQCEQGQRLVAEPHIFFFNDKFEPVGAYQLMLNLPYPHFCNAMPGMGTADKARNELLVTVQCFPIDRPAAKKASQIGESWQRMTLLFRVKAVNGKIELEQDQSCLRLPNSLESIPDARKALKQCANVMKP
jgi:hypothetical protein